MTHGTISSIQASRKARVALVAAVFIPALLTPVLEPNTAGADSDRTVEPRAQQIWQKREKIEFFDGSVAIPYPSNLTTSNIPGRVTDINLEIIGLNHSHPEDIDIMLVAPKGEAAIVMSDVGAGFDITNTDLYIDDEAGQAMPVSTKITSGNYRPTNDNTDVGDNDNFASPAPDSDGDTLAVFKGVDPNGTWKLFVRDDDSVVDSFGSIADGWRLHITTTNTGPVARDDKYKATEDKTLKVSSSKGVLANDTDADEDDDKITVVDVVKNPRKGKVKVKANGSFTYKPKKNKSGGDSFTYRIEDQDGETDEARVDIDIKDKKD